MRNYAVELVTPVLEYEDMPLLQEVVRAVRKAGGMTGAEYQAGIHVHIDGAPYTVQSLRNLVNIFASKENFLFDMLQVSPLRETYCQKVDRGFLEKLNKQKPKTIEEIQKLWYNGDMNEVYHHYSSTRYRACNLHSFFANGNWEMRACNNTILQGYRENGLDESFLQKALENSFQTYFTEEEIDEDFDIDEFEDIDYDDFQLKL